MSSPPVGGSVAGGWNGRKTELFRPLAEAENRPKKETAKKGNHHQKNGFNSMFTGGKQYFALKTGKKTDLKRANPDSNREDFELKRANSQTQNRKRALKRAKLHLKRAKTGQKNNLHQARQKLQRPNNPHKQRH